MADWDNIDRRRYYGLRKGDKVKVFSVSGILWGESEVLDYIPGDNNSVVIKSKNGTLIQWVAEWCEIIIKVEDQEKSDNNGK